MRVSLRKVGNSRGIIIPAAMLAAAKMGNEVELHLVGNSVVIESVEEPRSQWFVGYQAETDFPPLEALPIDEGDEEWVW